MHPCARGCARGLGTSRELPGRWPPARRPFPPRAPHCSSWSWGALQLGGAGSSPEAPRRAPGAGTHGAAWAPAARGPGGPRGEALRGLGQRQHLAGPGQRPGPAATEVLALEAGLLARESRWNSGKRGTGRAMVAEAGTCMVLTQLVSRTVRAAQGPVPLSRSKERVKPTPLMPNALKQDRVCSCVRNATSEQPW
jgi:hypothetical protein